MPIRESIANSLIGTGLSVGAVAVALFGIALINLMAFVALMGVLVHPRFRQVWEFSRWPVAAWLSCGLFGWLALSWYWSSAPLDQKAEYLRAYRELLLIPLFAVGLYFSGMHKALRDLMFWSLAVAVLISYLLWLDLIHIDGASLSLKNRIFFGVSSSVFMFWALLRSESGGWLHRISMSFCALAALGALLFIETGRTGYVLTFALLVYWLWGLTSGQHKLRMAGVLALLGVLGSGYLANDKLHGRVNQSVSNTLAYFDSGQPSSIGNRLEFYRVALLAIEQAPIVGHGVGSFRTVHGENVDPDRPWGKTDNPHQEYLLAGVQGGAIAALALLSIFISLWCYASKLEPSQRRLVRGGVLALALSCLFNSSLLDAGDGSFFTLFFAYALARGSASTI